MTNGVLLCFIAAKDSDFLNTLSKKVPGHGGSKRASATSNDNF
jgi:hypothetical protein